MTNLDQQLDKILNFVQVATHYSGNTAQVLKNQRTIAKKELKQLITQIKDQAIEEARIEELEAIRGNFLSVGEIKDNRLEQTEPTIIFSPNYIKQRISNIKSTNNLTKEKP